MKRNIYFVFFLMKMLSPSAEIDYPLLQLLEWIYGWRCRQCSRNSIAQAHQLLDRLQSLDWCASALVPHCKSSAELHNAIFTLIFQQRGQSVKLSSMGLLLYNKA